MKIVVLGGAGDMGSRAVEDLCRTDGVVAVTIADQNVVAARRLAERLQATGTNIEIATVDANVKDSLVAAMRGHDVAASALGPFHRFETKLVSAALEAEVDYASLCDEWQPTQKVFEKFSREAAEQGRTMVIGLGTSPGATNLAVAYAARELDTVTRADISCYQPFSGGGGPAVLQHMLHILNGKTQICRRGKHTRIAALSEETVVEFPRFGPLRVWNMGHSEPFTLPQTFPDLRDVNFMMGFGTGTSLLVQLARWGCFATPSRVDAAVAVLGWLEQWIEGEPAPGAIRVDVEGTISGDVVRRTLCGVGQMREVTGTALSLGAQMIARGELRRTGGVFSPEACIDPVRALQEFATKGLRLFADVEMTRAVGAGAPA